MAHYQPVDNGSEHPLVANGPYHALHQPATSHSRTPTLNSVELTDDKAPIITYTNTELSTLNSRAGKYEDHHHVKRFDRKLARWEILKKGLANLFITAFFSAALIVCLKAFEGFGDQIVLSKKDVVLFNAVSIGLSMFLGMSLLASLEQYAVTFRWTFLSRRYVSLEVFDLILNLSSLVGVMKLMIISLPGLRGRKFLRRIRLLKNVRDDGTKWMWLGCLLWLSINIGSQILVALLGLFWPMEPSDLPLLVNGAVAVADLNQWVVEEGPMSASDLLANETALESAWMYGMEAAGYPEFDFNNVQTDFSNMAGAPVYKNDSAYIYRFVNRDPENLFTNYHISSRTVSAYAQCLQYEVQGNGTYYQRELDDGTTEKYLEVRIPGQTYWETFVPPDVAEGSVTWIASIHESCGPRCTNFTVIQFGGFDDYVKNTSFFTCNSSLSEVSLAYAKTDITIHTGNDSAAVYGNDDFARIAAGSIGWTGIPWGSLEIQRRTYSQGAKWSPAHVVAKQEVEQLLMRYTIGAVAAFDDHGIRYTITDQTVLPTEGQQLNVDWPWIITILGGICAIQLFGLGLLLAFGTSTVLRDDSPFSMAMLLKNVIGKIGDAGMNMTGDEIKDHPKLIGKNIRYDYREGKDGEPNQVDVLFEGEGTHDGRRGWVQGSFV